MGEGWLPGPGATGENSYSGVIDAPLQTHRCRQPAHSKSAVGPWIGPQAAGQPPTTSSARIASPATARLCRYCGWTSKRLTVGRPTRAQIQLRSRARSGICELRCPGVRGASPVGGCCLCDTPRRAATAISPARGLAACLAEMYAASISGRGRGMAKGALFIGWGPAARGREQQALSLFQESIQYYARLQQQGEIDSFEPMQLEPHGGDLNGFLLLRGDTEKLARLKSRPSSSC